MVTTYNAIDEGMDPTGQTDNFPIFKSLVGDDVTIEFPPQSDGSQARYAFGDGNGNGWGDVFSVDNFTMRGADGNGNLNDSHRDAVLQPIDQSQDHNRLGNFDGTDHTLENLAFNAYDDNNPDITIWFRTQDNLLVDRVEFWGRFPKAQYTGSQFNAQIEDSTGSGTIKRCAFGTKYGGYQGDYTEVSRALSMTVGHVGDVDIDRVRVHDTGGTAIRKTDAPGSVTLTNSYCENAYNASIRINGTTDDTVRNCEVKITNPPDNSNTHTADAIRVDAEADSCNNGGLIEDCDIFIGSDAQTLGGIVNRGFSDVSDVTVKDCRIEYNNSDAAPIRVLNDGCGGSWDVDNVSVTGTNPTPVNEKSGTLTDCCFPGSADLTDWTTENISRGGCESPNFVLMSGDGFWPTTETGSSPELAAANALAPTRNGNVVTISGNVATTSPLPTYGNQVDSFEDGALTEYSGDTGSWTVETDSGFATHGDNVLKSDNTDGSVADIFSTSGLNNYPDDSTDIFRADAWAGETDTAQAALTYRVKDADNMWRLRISSKNDAVVLRKRDSGSNSNFASAAAVIEPGSRYTLEFDPTSAGGGEFMARVYDGGPGAQLLAELESDTFLDGQTGIGFLENNVSAVGSAVRFDDARLA